MTLLADIARGVLRAPILLYRYTLSPFLPNACRHMPSCSEYAEEAIRLNGPWKGSWLGLSRLLRCHPLGSHGFDPVPELREVEHPWYAPWRYGFWTGRHIRPPVVPDEDADPAQHSERH